MTQVTTGGATGLYYPLPLAVGALTTTSTSNMTVDATGEKIGVAGHFTNKDRATKTITKIGAMFGTIVSAGGSLIRASLQNVNAAAGPPMFPDDTADQLVDTALSGLTGSAFNILTLGTTRSVAFGEKLGVVWEFDPGGRLSSDSFIITRHNMAAATPLSGQAVTHNASAWAATTFAASVLLECDDGTFGTIAGALPYNSVSTVAFNSGSTNDKEGLKFQVPWACKTDGFFVAGFVAGTTSDFDVTLYDSDGTTVLDTVSYTGFQAGTGLTAGVIEGKWDSQISLAAGTNYYLAIVPTTVNNVTLRTYAVASANHLQAWPGGTVCVRSQKDGAGAWADVTTGRLHAGISISSFDDGTGSGGGDVIVAASKH